MTLSPLVKSGGVYAYIPQYTPSGGGHVRLSSLSDSYDSKALCEPSASTCGFGGAVLRLRSANSAVVSTDDKPMNLEMSLKFVMVNSFCAFPRDCWGPYP